MNAEELYNALKWALHCFNLSWNEKDKVTIKLTNDGRIHFMYGNIAMTYYVPSPEETE